MRPLHRPMFRYGGPIKEGVMSGIREPHAGGQLVRPGPGRPGYQGKIPKTKTQLGAWLATKLPWWSKIKTATKDIIPKTIEKGKQLTLPGMEGSGITSSGAGQTFLKNLKDFKPPTWVTKYPMKGISKYKQMFKAHPKATAVGTALTGGALTSDPALETYKNIGPISKWVAEAALPGWAERKLLPWKKGPTEAEIENAKLKKELAALNTEKIVPEVPQKSAEEIRAERIQKYRDIMDIKGMNKEAAYDSLIAASKVVGESGDFKGDIKSGKLINQVIQAASKQFDKPKKTKDAIDTLILKGEIEADIAAGKPSPYLKTAKDMVATGAAKNITEAMKLLTKSSNSMAATLGAIVSKDGRIDEEKVGIAYRGETGNIPKGMIKVSEVNEFIEDNPGKNELDYVKDYMTKTELAPGDYIIGKRVVTVDKDKKVSFFY